MKNIENMGGASDGGGSATFTPVGIREPHANTVSVRDTTHVLDHIPVRVPTDGATVTASAANPRRAPGPSVPPLGSGDRTIEAHLLLVLMEERLRTLWRYHRWFQRHPGWIIESEMENRAELRFVLRYLRKARKDAMRVPDPLDRVKDAWTGNPTCWHCGKEYEPLTGDGDGSCAYCYNGWSRDE